VTEEQRAVCDYEGSDYQERFWDRGERDYEDRVEAIALQRLLPQSGERLLDIGAGAGRNVPRYGTFHQIVLLDYARTQLEIARERLGNSDRYLYVVADAYRLPFAYDVFDAAVMVRALHHMVDPQAVMTQVRDVISPGANFVLEFANKRNLKSILRWMIRRQSWNPFHSEPIEFETLNFNFHPQKVRAWLETAQFEILRQLAVSHFRVGFLKRVVPVDLLVGLDSLFQWTGALWPLTPSVFLQSRALGARRAEGKNGFWRCPACSSFVMGSIQNGIQCGGCGRIWGFKDGIYDFKEPLADN
jgi:ubiquinone/menaquinone biosynthesis C-methylase UbiE